MYCCKNTSVKDVDLDLCMLVECFILFFFFFEAGTKRITLMKNTRIQI